MTLRLFRFQEQFMIDIFVLRKLTKIKEAGSKDKLFTPLENLKIKIQLRSQSRFA